MDLSVPFRGSAAIAAGAVSRARLRGPGFRRLFPDVYVRSDVPVDLTLRSRAAYLLVEGRGVLAGHSAAELLGASCGPANAPAEVALPRGRMRPRPELLVHQGVLCTDEIAVVDGVWVTSPVRTAYDLARRDPYVEAVVALDALSHRHGFAPAQILEAARRHLGARGSAQLDEVVRLASPLAESPMETRIRLAIVLGGLPPPVLQHPVGPYRLDLAYPGIRLAMEYDGAEHRTQERAHRDLDRQAYLSDAGWRVLRFRDRDVLRRPWTVGARVRAELNLAGRRRDVPVEDLALG